jgi:beta-mannosidase
MVTTELWAMGLSVSSLLLLASTSEAKAPEPIDHSISLVSGWEFRPVVRGPVATEAAWRAAVVPGDVHLDLLGHKLIPDPFYRENEASLQWIEDADWEYRTTFEVTPAILAHQGLDLVFEGLDGFAEVSLNDKHIVTADNMFRTWRTDAKPHLRAGMNVLHVFFPSPIKTAANVASTDHWRSRTRTASKTYVRKAAYEYGWDWGPRFVTSGIWRTVRLETWDAARIADLHIRERDVNAAVAHLVVELEIAATLKTPAEIKLDYLHAGKRSEISRRVLLRQGENHVDLPVEITEPALWQPAGYGPQNLYSFRAQVLVGGRLETEASRRTGLRSVVLRREPDPWGRSFEFVVNGVPVFAKGADVIPFDSFPNRVTTAAYRRVLESAREANMNMIRHWGGGYYETDEFYDLCDEMGIMVWQDFMFGNDWQPGTYAFKLQVTMEVQDQLRRLRDHPSIVLWCGNNETESAFNWGERTGLPAETRFQMWQDYLTLFSSVIARAVERLTPETPYWPSSPSADYEEIGEDYQSGDMHDWSVWHGRAPFAEYEKHFPRFMTEYGFQSFPEMRTLESFTLPEDRTSVFTDVMLAHQKNNAGNSIIRDYMRRVYGEPKNFAYFLYASQVLQAEGIKVGAEHLRRGRPRTMGSLYWQLNDCWPVASWSSLDYAGRWKALHYYARRFYSPLLVSPHVENGRVAVYVVSDKTEPTRAELRVRFMGVDGVVAGGKTMALEVPPLSSKIYMDTPLTEVPAGADAATTLLATDLLVGGKTVSRNLVYLVPTRQFKLPQTGIQSDLLKVGDTHRLRLSSNMLARSVYVSFGSLDVRLSDNYIDLLPGEPVEIAVEGAAGLEELRANIRIVSLADAFGSPANTAPFAPD